MAISRPAVRTRPSTSERRHHCQPVSDFSLTKYRGCYFFVYGLSRLLQMTFFAISRPPDKSCVADTLPTHQLKLVADLIAVLTELFNHSLSTATVPKCSAIITPLFSKRDLDSPIHGLTDGFPIYRSSQLVIRRTRLSTVDDRAFAVTGKCLWNSLPPDVTSAPTPTVFRNSLKTYLFSRSFPS